MSDAEPEVPPIPLPPTSVTPPAGAPSGAVPPVEPAPVAPPAPGYVAPPAPGYSAPAYPAAPGFAPPTGYAALPPVRKQGLAITSLILGIASIVFFFFLLSLPAGIAAVITGHLAQRRQPYARGLWITGLITGYVGILIGLLLGVAIVVLVISGAMGDSSYDY